MPPTKPLPTLLLLLLALPRTHASETCPPLLTHDAPTPRVVGGDPATPPSALFTVSLINALSGSCTGSLLSARWVLTARHCTPSPATFVFLAPTGTLTSGALVPVRRTIPHPGLEEVDDIALIELAEDAPKNATFIALNTLSTHPLPGAATRAVGFGITSHAGPSNDQLRQVDIPAVSYQTCAAEYSPSAVSLEKTVCAGYAAGRCGICSGDSGGPLLQFTKAGKPVQVGISARTVGCAWRDTPQVYTRVSYYVPWMRAEGADFAEASDAEQVIPSADGAQVREGRSGEGFVFSGGIPPWALGLAIGGPIVIVVGVLVALLVIARRAGRMERRETEVYVLEESEVEAEGAEGNEVEDGGVAGVAAQRGVGA